MNTDPAFSLYDKPPRDAPYNIRLRAVKRDSRESGVFLSASAKRAAVALDVPPHFWMDSDWE